MPRSASYVAEKMAGHYRLLIVESEGSGVKRLREWILELTPTPADLEARWLSERPQHLDEQYPLVGVMQHVRDGYLQADGKVVPGRLKQTLAPDSVRIEYSPRQKTVEVVGRSFIARHGNTYYNVYSVYSEVGFDGRWEDGGSLVRLISTSFGELRESSRGYFCARRMPPK